MHTRTSGYVGINLCVRIRPGAAQIGVNDTFGQIGKGSAERTSRGGFLYLYLIGSYRRGLISKVRNKNISYCFSPDFTGWL